MLKYLLTKEPSEQSQNVLVNKELNNIEFLKRGDNIADHYIAKICN